MNLKNVSPEPRKISYIIIFFSIFGSRILKLIISNNINYNLLQYPEIQKSRNPEIQINILYIIFEILNIYIIKILYIIIFFLNDFTSMYNHKKNNS